MSLCVSVCAAEICLKQSIFIFLGQRALREHSECNQRAIRGISYLMLRATLFKLMAPSTESCSNETVSSRNVPRYLLIRYLPALFLKASEKLVYQADQAILHDRFTDALSKTCTFYSLLAYSQPFVLQDPVLRRCDV